jgi:two-component system sensor histidine kinase RegB
MDSIGEPYVTTRPSARSAEGDDDEPSGLGLGFFIAKTLLERSGASVTLANRDGQEGGAVVRINWPRASFALPPELRSGNKAAAG